ncbi:MAG: hypothetical protein AAFV53_10240 [Myxococcota bacterium]
MSDAFQVLSDCPNCLVEGSVIEILDPSVAQGVALEARCQMCGYQSRLGAVENPGERFMNIASVRLALSRWSAAEGEPDVEAFCVNNFSGLSSAEIGAHLLAGERVQTNFDVVAFLFPGLSGSGASGASETAPVQRASSRAMVERPVVVTPPPVPEDPRVVVRALVAVMLADGSVRPGERVFVDQFIAEAGLAPLQEDELRPWRPGDLGWPRQPESIIQAMVALAYVDRQRDGSEWRVIREFARHWGFSLKALEAMGEAAEHKAASSMKRLWWALRGLLWVKDDKTER